MPSTALGNSNKGSLWGSGRRRATFLNVSHAEPPFLDEILKLALLFLLSKHSHRHQIFSPFLFSRPILTHYCRLGSICPLSWHLLPVEE